MRKSGIRAKGEELCYSFEATNGDITIVSILVIDSANAVFSVLIVRY